MIKVGGLLFSDDVLQKAAEEYVKDVAPKVKDFLVSRIHKSFTDAADELSALGYLSQEERIGLSSAIGDSLNTFCERIEKDFKDLVDKEMDKQDAIEIITVDSP